MDIFKYMADNSADNQGTSWLTSVWMAALVTPVSKGETEWNSAEENKTEKDDAKGR